ncbi:FHA domain-containing protein, partial [Calothrix rhizosoleniae]|uniref:FHA domain-containing protein n=1 Tax=Calothrix rhizosoleniae TaxID=888997 RepID=UPI00117751E2
MAGNFEQPTQVTPKPFLEINNQGQVLRLDLEKSEHRLGRGREWADLDVPVGWEVCSRRQAILIKEGDEYRIFDGDKSHPSRNGIFLNQNRIDFQEGYLLKNGAQLEIGQSPHNRIVLTYFNSSASPNVIPTKRRLVLKDLKEWPVQLGRGLNSNRYASMQLDAPTVSRLHATILPDGKNGHILQDNSTNGTFVDGQWIDKRVQLQPGNIIHIGPFSLLYQRD